MLSSNVDKKGLHVVKSAEFHWVFGQSSFCNLDRFQSSSYDRCSHCSHRSSFNRHRFSWTLAVTVTTIPSIIIISAGYKNGEVLTV